MYGGGYGGGGGGYGGGGVDQVGLVNQLVNVATHILQNQVGVLLGRFRLVYNLCK